MSQYPVIGIFSVKHMVGLTGGYVSFSHYVEQTRAAGGLPVQLPVQAEMRRGEMEQLIGMCDGFLLPGGADFEPEWYGETLLSNLTPSGHELEHGVQAAALECVRLAAASGKPVLGICLGIQVLNVALGGSLYQDIPTQITAPVTHSTPDIKAEDRGKYAHTVRMQGMLRELLGKEEIMVNSFHHQAVHTVAPGLTAIAWAPDGVIEAVESGSGKMLAVQWHPENLAHFGDPNAKKLFRWLVETAEE